MTRREADQHGARKVGEHIGHDRTPRDAAAGLIAAGQLPNHHRARTLGCDGAQGFLFGRLVPEDEVDELLMPPATARLT